MDDRTVFVISIDMLSHRSSALLVEKIGESASVNSINSVNAPKFA